MLAARLQALRIVQSRAIGYGTCTARWYPRSAERPFSSSVATLAERPRRGQASRAGRKAIDEFEVARLHTDLFLVMRSSLGLRSDGLKMVEWLLKLVRIIVVRNHDAQGAVEIIRHYLSEHVESYEQETRPSREAKVLLEDFKRLSQDGELIGRLCYAVGHFLWNGSEHGEKSSYEFAKFLLKVSVEAGGRQAHLDLWLLANINDEEVPVATQMAIKDAAIKQLDWRAMQLYIESLLKNTKSTSSERALAFELALDLNGLVEPGVSKGSSTYADDQKHSPSPLSRSGLYCRPWELLRDAALAYADDNPSGPEFDRAKHALEQALSDGVEKFNSVDAMNFRANLRDVVEKYSEEWIKLKTTAAAAGDVVSCNELGRYLVEKSGWYPSTAGARDDEKGRTAISWMVLGANLSTPSAEEMAKRYLMAALVLRENGFESEGFRWLQYGIDTMSQTCEDSAGIEKRMDFLESVEKRWRSDSFPYTAKQLLGKPMLSEEETSPPI